MSDNNEISAVITTEEPEIAATLSDLRYLVFVGKKGDKGDPAKLVGTLREDGTLYVSNLYSYEDLEEATF